jgi:hypothetical protein
MNVHDTIAGIIRNAVFGARDAGRTIYEASEDAADQIMFHLAKQEDPVRDAVEALLKRWDQDRLTLTTDDWRMSVADSTLLGCIHELRYAVDHATEARTLTVEVG